MDKKTNYFEPRDKREEYPYKVDIPIQEKYEKVEKIFNYFYPEEILEKAKKDAKVESESKKLEHDNFIYGEIVFRAISYMLEYLMKEHNLLNTDGYFYDLGSGTGRAVIGAALSASFGKYIGIEYLDSLYKTSEEIHKKFEDEFDNIYKENIDILPVYKTGRPIIELIHGDFLEVDLSKASFIFINSTSFTDDLIDKLINRFEQYCKTGCIITNTSVELTKLNKEKWEILPHFRRYMSWGIATFNAYTRK